MIDIERIAQKMLDEGRKPTERNIEDRIQEVILDNISDWIVDKVDDVLEMMCQLSHPEPRTKAEYNEKFGLDKKE